MHDLVNTQKKWNRVYFYYMSFISRFRAIGETDKARAVEKLIKNSTPDFDFFLFIVLSVLMATFGLLLDNAAVIIGSMLLAPILYPVLSFSLGIVMADSTVIYRSFYTIIKSFGLGIFAAFLATLFLTDVKFTNEILMRVEPSLLYFMVALVAGVAVSFSTVKPKLGATLSGIAVSVALIPPVAVLGIGLAQSDWLIVSGSFILFLLNVAGIVFASMVSFSLMNLHVEKQVADTMVQKEEARLQREETKIQKLDEKENGESI